MMVGGGALGKYVGYETWALGTRTGAQVKKVLFT